jgi:hypothetical protein
MDSRSKYIFFNPLARSSALARLGPRLALPPVGGNHARSAADDFRKYIFSLLGLYLLDVKLL